MHQDDLGLDEFFRSSDELYCALPGGVSVVFDLTGPGGGLWTVQREDTGRTRVTLHETSRPDCRLRCSVEDFCALIAGDLNVRAAFLQGRLQIRGDVGLVWRLQKILVSRKGA